jgi:hypothetical protein
MVDLRPGGADSVLDAVSIVDKTELCTTFQLYL